MKKPPRSRVILIKRGKRTLACTLQLPVQLTVRSVFRAKARNNRQSRKAQELGVMSTLTQTIAKAHYVANEQQVETLAREHHGSTENMRNADGTFLRILIVAAQAKLGTGRRGRRTALDSAAQAQVLETVNERFYPHVLTGITTEDIAAVEGLEPEEAKRRTLERNRRSAFARSAMTTIRAYVQGGGDLRSIEVATVTKGALRAAVAPPEPTDKVARQIERAQGALVRAIKRRARGDPDAANEAIDAAIDALEALRPPEEPEQPQHAETSTVIGARRTRAGTPVMVHQPGAR